MTDEPEPGQADEPDEQTLPDALDRLARDAVAYGLTGAGAQDMAAFAQAAREALAARQIAIALQDHDDALRLLRRGMQRRDGQIATHRQFLATLRDEFAAADTPIAKRVSDRINSHLLETGP